ncbi:hypothetical protein AB0F17_34995 [Nonomuraea sp. NPDC026600]|uniref:hypothetical protein n=1 Tax=Nonomuraea sp. NPDC026600 TaxID=3155363 RepID=UPI0033C7A19E
MTSPLDDIARNRAALLPPELKELMDAHDEMLKRAYRCAVLAADADASVLPVAADYVDAVCELDAALAGSPVVVASLRQAARRFSEMFDLTIPNGGSASEDEDALIDAVQLLRETLATVDEALAKNAPRGN